MILKLAFLIAYFLLVFIGARLFEFYASSVASWKCFNNIIPAILDNFREKPQEKSEKVFDYFGEARHHHHHYDNNFEEGVESDDDSQPIGVPAKDAQELQITSFNSYREFEVNIEDAANIWVVQVKSPHNKQIFSEKQWNGMSLRLKRFGIRMGTYSCSVDPRLCIQHRIYSSTVILITPKGHKIKGNIDFHIFQTDREIRKDKVYNWIKSKLKSKVKTVHSLSELTERPMSRYNNILSKPSMFFVYKSNERVPPLLFTTLSVKFTGRINFYMFKTKEVLESGNVFAMNPSTMYTYGKHRGEYFTYSCVEFFLRTLHPEVNDIFVISVILLNMACWLELFLQKGGPLKRLFYYIWGFAIGNIILVSIWLLLIQVLYMPQVQPLLELCLKNFQHVMFTNIAAIIRQDIIQLSKHIHIVIFGFIGYGIVLGFLHYKLRRESDRIFFTSVMDIIRYDIEELKELFYSVIGFITPSLRIYRFEEGIERILLRLAAPDLWLHSKSPADYIHGLPTWTYYCNELDCSERDHSENISDEDIQIDGDSSPSVVDSKQIDVDSSPSEVDSKMNDDCVICLDIYKCGDTMRGLPCGHSFHKSCIDSWLIPNNEMSHHRCPVCRWPADIKKGEAIEVVDMT